MFVMNCTVDQSQKLKFPLSKSEMKRKNRNKKRKGQDQGQEEEEEEEFHSVKCDHCSTEVAVLDKDEVYHFFNVVPSHT